MGKWQFEETIRESSSYPVLTRSVAFSHSRTVPMCPVQEMSMVGDEKRLLTSNIAVELMQKHGLQGWCFAFNKNLRRAGVCFYPFGGKPGRIELSVHYVELNDEDEIRDTILHEIAHALVGLNHGHDGVWKAKCVEIGARPERCYAGDGNMPKGRWQAHCGGCEKKFYRHRRPKRLNGWHCTPCGPAHGAIVWADHVSDWAAC